MSFGFSVGDFLCAASLIEQVVSALHEAGGSAFQYQRLTLELHTLQRALQEVDRLEAVEGLEATVEAIKATALSCQLPLGEFLASVRKYDKCLGLGQTAGVMKDVLYKVKWAACKKLEAVIKLHSEIMAYVGGINLLLGLYQVKLKALYEQRVHRRYETLNILLSNVQIQTRTVGEDVAVVRYKVEEGTQMVREDIQRSSEETSLALRNLQQNYKASIRGLLKTAGTFSEVALQTFTKVAEIYNILVAVRSRLLKPDTRYTWFQEPIRFEDAYGRVWPIPIEYDYPMMEGVLRGKFQSGRGKGLVERSQWQLFDPTNTRNVITANNWEPIPGMKITMAMIIPQTDDMMICPRLSCTSKIYNDALGGGKICSVCGTWFDSVPDTLRPVRFTEVDDDVVDNDSLASDPQIVSSERMSKGQIPAVDESQSELDFKIDNNDLQFLKHARLRSTRRSEIPIEQFVQLSSLAQKVSQVSKTTSGPRTKLSISLNSLSEALNQLLQEKQQPNSPLNGQRKASELDNIMSVCSQILLDIDSIIRPNNPEMEKGKRLRQRVMGERVTMGDLRRNVSTLAAAIKIFLNLAVKPSGRNDVLKFTKLTDEIGRPLLEISLRKGNKEKQLAENKKLKDQIKIPVC